MEDGEEIVIERSAVGSLVGQLELPDDWDSPQTNAEITADFEGNSDPFELSGQQ